MVCIRFWFYIFPIKFTIKFPIKFTIKHIHIKMCIYIISFSSFIIRSKTNNTIIATIVQQHKILCLITSKAHSCNATVASTSIVLITQTTLHKSCNFFSFFIMLSPFQNNLGRLPSKIHFFK